MADNTTPTSADHPLHGLYEFLLREFEAIPTSGEAVMADIRPHFNALCEYMAIDETKNPTPAFADVIERMREALTDAQNVREIALHHLRRLTSAAHGMMVGISVHNRLSRDVGARKDDIDGPVVDDLNKAYCDARNWLAALALLDSKPDNQGGA